MLYSSLRGVFILPVVSMVDDENHGLDASASQRKNKTIRQKLQMTLHFFVVLQNRRGPSLYSASKIWLTAQLKVIAFLTPHFDFQR
jgi:hypothetical protein